jgi:DNA-binding NarL/FixJ family response regulator
MVESHPQRTPIRILVAESNPQLASVLTWVLAEDDRFQVVAQVHDGDEAVACHEPFDMALVDLSVFGLGGLGTIARLHQRKPAPAIAVLAETDAVYLRHAAASEGAIGYLVKPADLEQLGDRLAELVDMHRNAPDPVPG